MVVFMVAAVSKFTHCIHYLGLPPSYVLTGCLSGAFRRFPTNVTLKDAFLLSPVHEVQQIVVHFLDNVG